MVKKDGSKTIEEVFWDSFCSIVGERVREDEPHFEEYYRTDFQNVKAVCRYNENAAQTVNALKAMGVCGVCNKSDLSRGGYRELYPLGGTFSRGFCALYHL